MCTGRARLVALPLLLILSGCADSPQLVAKEEQIEKTMPVCVAGPDCDAKWHAARIWVYNHAGFYVRTANSNLIDTYFASENDERPVMTVTKEPIGNNEYKIELTIRCTNFFGCVPNQYNEALAFNQTIGAVKP